MKLGLKLWSTNTDNYLEEARRLYKEGWLITSNFMLYQTL